MFHYPSAELMREKQKKRKPEIGASSPYVDSDYQITQVEEKLEFFVRWTLSFIVFFFFFLTNGRTKYSITRELTVTCFLSADRSLISTKMRLNWPKARYEPSSILLLGWLQCPPFPLHQSATPTWFFFSLFLFFSFYLSISLSLPPPPPPPPPLPLPIIRNFENSVSFPCLFVTLHWSWWRPTRPIC